MARQALVPVPGAYVQDDTAARRDPVAQLRSLMTKVLSKINGFISFGDAVSTHQAGNFNAQWMEYTTPTTSDTPFAIPHGLGRVPSAVFLGIGPRTTGHGKGLDDNGDFNSIFVWADPSTAWTTSMVWLRSNQASAKLLLLIV